MHKLALSVVLAMLFSSCAHNYTLTSASQVRGLPTSRGPNGGSYAAETQWLYRGTACGYYEFYYFYNIGNLLHRRDVHVYSGIAELHFPEFTFSLGNRWATLRQQDGTLHFYPYRSSRNATPVPATKAPP